MNAASRTSPVAQEPSSRAPATRQTSKRPDAPDGRITRLNGYLVTYTHRLAPWGELVGGRIPTSKAAAVKMAVEHLVKQAIDIEIGGPFEARVRLGDYDAALAIWSEFQQRRALEFKSSEDGDPPQRIDILELPIDLPE